jgi:hypothetical protein
MAQKSLQALHASEPQPAPAVHTESEGRQPLPPVEDLPGVASPGDTAEPERSARDRYVEQEFEDPFAELDSLSDVFSEDPEAVRRAETTPATADTSVPSSSSRKDGQDSKASKPATKTSWSMKKKDDREDKKPMSSSKLSKSGNPIRVLAFVGFAIVLILLLIFVLRPMIFGGDEDVANQPRQQPAAQTSAPAQAGSAGEGGEATGGDQEDDGGEGTAPSPGGDQQGGEDAASGDGGAQPQDGEQEAAGPQVIESPTPLPGPTATPETPQVAQPSGEQPAQPANNGGTTSATPDIVAQNTPMESEGWLYDFNQSICAPFSCATPWFANIGTFQPKGRFVIVLAMVENRTGETQPLPQNFLVLKDSQNRVYNSLPRVSEAYVTPGGNADLSQEDPIPPDGISRSVALVFDVSADATELVLYSPTKPDQGWLVLQSIQ